MKKAGLIKGINTAGQALHPAPVGAFRGKPRGIKPCFDCARSVMSEQARPRLSLRLSIIFLQVFILFFFGCSSTSPAQKEIDKIIPKHEQVKIGNDLTIMVAVIDSEELTMAFNRLDYGPKFVLPGLSPGIHSIGFYQGHRAEASSRPNTDPFPNQGTTTTSGNVTVTTYAAPVTATVDFSQLKFIRTSDLITMEHSFESGRYYRVVNDEEKKPVIVDSGYSDWYWDWRSGVVKSDETLLNVNFNLPRGSTARFLLAIDGEAYFFRNTETKQKIVIPKGSHTLQIINEGVDPDQNKITAALEYNFTEDITDVSIIPSGSSFRITMPNALLPSPALAESNETPALLVYPGKGESIVTIQRKSTMVGSAHQMKIWIDGEEVKSDITKGMEVKLLVANGEHTIQADSSKITKGSEISFSVSGEEIVFFAEPMGLYGARFKLTETGRNKF